MPKAYGGPLDGGDLNNDEGIVLHETAGQTHRYMRAVQVGITETGQLGSRVVYFYLGEAE